jgi:mono/diheme cytochrome c family protein
MKEEQKTIIKKRYDQSLQKGERFWPDSIYKDAIMALAIFIILVLMATFIGVPVEPKADPSDTSYVPRPEWYFLFLFKFLALYGQIPLVGKIEWLATVIIPGIFIGLLVCLPFIDRSPNRFYGKRIFAIGIMSIVITSMICLTYISDIPTTLGEGFYLPGILQTIGGLIIPALGYILLALMNFYFKKTSARIMIGTTVLTCILMVGLTIATIALAPPTPVTEVSVASTLADQVIAGQDLYSVNCVECHGDDGKVTTIEGVQGLEGKIVMPINGHDVLYTLDDASLAEVIAYGRPDAGMNPFGKAYNTEGLTKSEIDYIVTFMRYSWDDRFELPPMAPLFPSLASGEVPSYDVHIAPIVKRYCISCHRAGKDNHNYLMTSYDEILNSGDEVPLVTAGDENSILLKVLMEQTITDAAGEQIIGVMPPKKVLGADIVEVFRLWIMNGMPKTVQEAAALFRTPTPGMTPNPSPTP